MDLMKLPLKQWQYDRAYYRQATRRRRRRMRKSDEIITWSLVLAVWGFAAFLAGVAWGGLLLFGVAAALCLWAGKEARRESE
jgi:hypothetical protein